MIAYLKGKLALIQEESIIVDVGGIGYEVICPNPFIYQGKVDKELFIFTYQHFREDDQSLFGFKNEDEKYLFTKLISVSGIGPKSAISILGAVNVSEFISAVELEDEKYLTQFPGIGKKTARQIILDLKGKLSGLFSIDQHPEGETARDTNHSGLDETQEALLALGYSRKEINQIMPQLKQSQKSETNALIKAALALLVKS